MNGYFVCFHNIPVYTRLFDLPPKNWSSFSVMVCSPKTGLDGMRVNAIAPGRIETILAKLSSQESNEAMLKATPMGRFGTPEELAKVVVFLASDMASYITGETVNVNGGWIMD